MEKTNIIILAGGLGKRMNSDLPKVLNKINNKPMIVNIIETVLDLNINKIFIIVGKYKNIIQTTIEDYIKNDFIEYVLQEEALGTGHAIQCCYNKLLLNHKYKTFILSGDVPLIKKATLERMLKLNKDCILLTANIDNPYGYGRIIREKKNFLKIQEEKDCIEEERKINEINAGIYLIQTGHIIGNIINITNNNKQNEYYLTDIFKLIKEKGISVDTVKLDKCENYQIKGINTKEDLVEVNNISREIMSIPK